MKPIAQTFIKKGFVHDLVERTGDIAIFRRFKQGSTREHFEVVRIGRHNGFEIGGVNIAPAETYPSSEQWGTSGWTYLNQEEAKAKADALHNQFAK